MVFIKKHINTVLLYGYRGELSRKLCAPKGVLGAWFHRFYRKNQTPVDNRPGKWYCDSVHSISINSMTEESFSRAGRPREPGICCKTRRGPGAGYRLPSAEQGQRPNTAAWNALSFRKNERRFLAQFRWNRGAFASPCWNISRGVELFLYPRGRNLQRSGGKKHEDYS